MAKFAERVTRLPAGLRRQDIDTLRKHSLSDRDILDAVEVIAYFNYINRIADALGIDPEPEMPKARTRKQGRTALQRRRAFLDARRAVL